MVKALPIEYLQICNYRKHSAEHIGRLAGSMREHGLRTPITVYEDGEEGHFVVWSGEGRLLAARRLGWKEINAVIVPRPLGEAERLAGQLTDNDSEPASPIAEAQAISTMLSFGKNEMWVAQMLSRSPLWVQQRLQLLGLPEVIQKRISAGELSVTAALKLRGKPAAQEQVAATEGRITIREVERTVAAEVLDEPERIVEDYETLLSRLEIIRQAVRQARAIMAQAGPIDKARLGTALEAIRKEME